MLLLIEWEQTDKKYKGDRKFFITTKEREPITMFKLCELINLLAYNEYKIKEDGGYDVFLFENVIKGAIQHAKDGLRWDDDSTISDIKKLCIKTHMRFEQPNFRVKQLKIGDCYE